MKQDFEGWRARWGMAPLRTKSFVDDLPAEEGAFWRSFWAKLGQKIDELRG
jgi:hypothetical protein